jgi:hypothetical protein
LLVNLAQIQLADEFYREAGQVLWRQDISHADFEIERLFIIGGSKLSSHTESLHLIYGQGRVLRQTARQTLNGLLVLV